MRVKAGARDHANAVPRHLNATHGKTTKLFQEYPERDLLARPLHDSSYVPAIASKGMPAKKTTIDIGEDIAQQRKVWIIERVAWVLMAIIMLGALLGFTGHGPYSEREVSAPQSGLVVSYQRFERYHAQTLLSLRLTAVRGDETRVRIGQEFLRKVEVMRIEPEPERIELDDAFFTYVFNTNAPGLVLFHYKPIEAGPLQIDIGLDDEPLQQLPQFVYP